MGEFGLISHLTKDIRPNRETTLKGIGDDAAILGYGGDLIAVSTDILMEGINFDLTYTPLQHLGYKAAVAGFSNIYAMNAQPQQLLVSVAVSAKFSVQALEQLYHGLKLACEHHQADLVGGDTNSSLTGLAINITTVGTVQKEKITYRNTAKTGDLICVTGNLGASYMGLQVLEREKKLYEENPDIQPQLNDYEYVVGRYLKPEARKDIVGFFASTGLVPTSMIDVSDGLSSELLHICTGSKAGCNIHHHKIPVADETADVAEEFYMEPLIAALNGGDDFELLFTVGVDDYDKVLKHPDISIIGHIVDQEEGCHLISEDGTKIAIQAQGW